MKRALQKTVAIIPAYLPKDNFLSFVAELIKLGIAEIIVVNDGSGKKCDIIFEKLSLIKNVKVLSYSTNRGKGFALKYAFRYAKKHFDPSYTFVCCDCDGQHECSDVIRVLSAAIDFPDKFLLGARDFSHQDIPWKSKSGNMLTRWCFKSLYRLSLSDTQTGLRAFSYSFLQKLITIPGERFEYEMNTLIHLYKQGVDFKEIPIETLYTRDGGNKRESHFKTVRDSFRIFKTLMGSIGLYMLSSLLSAAADVGIFYLLYSFIFNSPGSWMRLIFPVVIARILSSIINFTVNFKFVFRSKSRIAIVKYYLLWTFQLALSCGTVYVLNRLLNDTLYVTVFKAIIDFLVALFSFKIQSVWVFTDKNESNLNFYGIFLRFNRIIFNIFSKRYTSFVNPQRYAAAVYIAKHGNMNGPIKLTQSLSFDVHSLAFYPFFEFKSCFKQYSDYTFTKRYNRHGIKAILGKIAAFFAALYVPMLVRSAKAIPVYRTNLKAVITYKKAISYLIRGENIAVFPTVDYKNDNKEKDIYSGFVYLDKLYFNSTGKHLDFIVLDINKEKREIREMGHFKIDNSKSYGAEIVELTEKIRNTLFQ